jgi:alpha-tubulin suppressor-like RCC1 family protein
VSSAFLTKSGNIYTCGSDIYNGLGENCNILIPKKLNFDTNFKFIKISSGEGGYHFGALNENGDVYVWGHNRVGQLGINPKELTEVKRKLKIMDDDDHEIVLTVPYKLNINRRVFDIEFSWGHSCLFFSNNDISLFGRNCCNQLGISKDHCTIDKKSHEYYYKQNILNTYIKVRSIKLLKYGTIILSNNILYYYGILNEDELIKYMKDDNFELKKLTNLYDYDYITIINGEYVLVK